MVTSRHLVAGGAWDMAPECPAHFVGKMCPEIRHRSVDQRVERDPGSSDFETD